MSCDVAIAAFLVFAQAGPSASMPPPAAAIADAAPASVAGEPLFKDIVGRASTLKDQVDAYRKSLAASSEAVTLPRFSQFSEAITELSLLDQKGHEVLVARGSKDDLKCILHGISQDLPAKLAAVAAAKTGHDQDAALRDMSYLLRDNVEVITAPPQPAA
ncbi:MAG TPA: hypothetical protein VHZ26_15230 [Caulobacteraceae bacterium]|jgi:hypothetical protein|nr:hypothetical protein [Caulobacteraceae bacterium]